MQEWSSEDRFNSFNSWKGLLYAPWYEGVRDKKLLPPVESSIDPIHTCNLSCKHCNAIRYRQTEPQKMSTDHLFNLVDFLSDWGVKANCFGGGGEPTMHPDMAAVLLYSKAKGMESSLSTNGTIMPDDLADAIAVTCRWIGISVDAASGGTYTKLKGTNLFSKVLGNIRKLVTVGNRDSTKCDINYKFLISPVNQHEIYRACEIARDLGVRDFQARPMDYNHQGMGELRGIFGDFDMSLISDQFAACHELSNADFHVYTPTHKFDKHFHGHKKFSHCYASYLIIQLCADGNVYYCIDQRHNTDLVLGTHYPNPRNILNFWGKQHHVGLVYSDTSRHCKTRCTLGPYCEQCEQLFINTNDPMCINFA